MIEANKSLVELNLACLGIDAEGGAMIADALKMNATLTKFSLHSNCFKSEASIRGEDGVKRIVAVLVQKK